MKVLRAPRMERCTGCNSCSLACARLVHRKLSWETAGIRISSAGGITSGYEARVCIACDPAPCAQVCPTGALRQRQGGGIIHQRKLCIQCGRCHEACPLDAIAQDHDGSPYICYHCGQCVKFCPQGCIELQTIAAGKETADAG